MADLKKYPPGVSQEMADRMERMLVRDGKRKKMERGEDSNISLVESSPSNNNGIVEMTTIEIKAKEKALINDYQKIYARYYADMKKRDEKKYIGQLPEATRKIALINLENEEKDKYNGLTKKEIYGYWLTLSPEHTHTLDELVKCVNKIMKKKAILEAIWVYEQSGREETNNLGYHPHAHILIRTDKNVKQMSEPSRFINGLKNTSEKLGDVNKRAFFYLKCVNEETYNKKERYMEGFKQDSKMEKVEGDKIWRRKMKLEDIYRLKK